MDVSYEETFRSVTLPDGTTVAYNEAGAGDRAVILVHGSGPGATGWSNFNPNIGALADDFHVYALDMPGWGESSSRPAADYRHPEVVVQFMAAVGIDRAALVGNSMGGMIAIAVAARHPERVSHLITMGPGSGGVTIFDAGGGLTEGLKILYKGYADPSPENFLATVDIMTYDTPQEVAAPLAEQRSANARRHQEHLDNWLEGSVDGPPLRYGASEREIASITAPALLIHGRDDRVVPFEHTLRLVRLISDSRAYLINRCGHWAQLEHAEEFNRLVRDFVLNTSGTGEKPALVALGG
ncbi:alpha/beta hydrolase [Raineyella sp. W15-4]|uniref:alpha/beta fold hydrolase n=1 Tax=Raineyella sp. W15-4 TaxID=3081651 RepID=UPI00295307C3|nr:alpha/beta hydrolase [Raineyella sp. W15-4]WOQ15687.1 alpha/beta hydrolase [Raineyella sp. W15-4]